MKALVFHGAGKIVHQDYPDPKLEKADDIIVGVKACSICGSDLHLYHGDKIGPFDYSQPMPHFCVGHETIGEVLEVGKDVKTHRVGDAVMISPGMGCGHCPACLAGQVAYCHNPSLESGGAFGTHPGLDGGQAEYLRVPHADLFARRIPEGVSDDQALLLTDALSTGYFGATGANVKQGDTALVIGLGPVGLMAVESCFALGAQKVYAIDPVAARRSHGETLGAQALEPAEALATIKEATGGRGVDCVIEAVGHAETISQALKIVRPGGRVAVLGIVQGDGQVSARYIQMKGVQFFAGTASVVDCWDELIQLIQSGKIRAEGLFSHHFQLSEGAQAYELFDARGADCLKLKIEVGRE